MPRRRGLCPRLLAAVVRSNATLAFAAERQVVRPTSVRMSLAPEPYLSACLRVLYVAALEARLIGYGGHERGLSPEDSDRVADLADAVRLEIPDAATPRLRPRLLAAVVRSKVTLAFAAERQVVSRTRSRDG